MAKRKENGVFTKTEKMIFDSGYLKGREDMCKRMKRISQAIIKENTQLRKANRAFPPEIAKLNTVITNLVLVMDIYDEFQIR